MLQRESGEHISVSPGRGEHPGSAARPQLRSTCRGSHEWQLGCHLACSYAAYTCRGACTRTPPAPDWHTALPYCYTRVLAATRSRLSKPPCPGLQSLLHRGQLFQPHFNSSALENLFQICILTLHKELFNIYCNKEEVTIELTNWGFVMTIIFIS